MPPDNLVIHIVDDEEAVRKSLAFMLMMAGFTVRQHNSATDFLAAAPSIRHACLVTDLRMPDMTGVELLRRLDGIPTHIPTIVVTGHGDVPLAVEAMKAGARDFIEKPFEEAVLVEAINRVATEIEAESGFENTDAIRSRVELLSAREREVLLCVVSGLPNKAIAFDLNISPRTVEAHRAAVMSKMGAGSLPELVRMALAAGIPVR